MNPDIPPGRGPSRLFADFPLLPDLLANGEGNPHDIKAAWTRTVQDAGCSLGRVHSGHGKRAGSHHNAGSAIGRAAAGQGAFPEAIAEQGRRGMTGSSAKARKASRKKGRLEEILASDRLAQADAALRRAREAP